MKETQREGFRWAPHTGGLAIVKPKDFDLDGEVEAPSPYAAWKIMLAEKRSLNPGDLLETIGPNPVPPNLQIAKYIGFEPAQWFVPETRPVAPELVAEPASNPAQA